MREIKNGFRPVIGRKPCISVVPPKFALMTCAHFSPITGRPGNIYCCSIFQLQSDLPSACLQIFHQMVCSLKGITKRYSSFSLHLRYSRKEMEVPPRIELGIRELQSHALPLGYGTKSVLVYYIDSAAICQSKNYLVIMDFIARLK